MNKSLSAGHGIARRHKKLPTNQKECIEMRPRKDASRVLDSERHVDGLREYKNECELRVVSHE